MGEKRGGIRDWGKNGVRKQNCRVRNENVCKNRNTGSENKSYGDRKTKLLGQRGAKNHRYIGQNKPFGIFSEAVRRIFFVNCPHPQAKWFIFVDRQRTGPRGVNGKWHEKGRKIFFDNPYVTYTPRQNSFHYVHDRFNREFYFQRKV